MGRVLAGVKEGWGDKGWEREGGIVKRHVVVVGTGERGVDEVVEGIVEGSGVRYTFLRPMGEVVRTNGWSFDKGVQEINVAREVDGGKGRREEVRLDEEGGLE